MHLRAKTLLCCIPVATYILHITHITGMWYGIIALLLVEASHKAIEHSKRDGAIKFTTDLMIEVTVYAIDSIAIATGTMLLFVVISIKPLAQESTFIQSRMTKVKRKAKTGLVTLANRIDV